MANFPKLIPAFTVQVGRPISQMVSTNQPSLPKKTQVVILPPSPISSSLILVPLSSTGSTIVSEPSYPIKLNAAIEHGADYITAAPSGRYVHLDVNAAARDSATNGLIRFKYTGKISTTGPAGKVLRGEAGAATTDFGEACEFPLPILSSRFTLRRLRIGGLGLMKAFSHAC